MKPCAQCGLPVLWRRVEGRRQCFNPDDSIHWDLCSKERFAKVQREGKPFDKPSAAGYVMPLRVHFSRLSAKPKRGKGFKEDGCDCGLPPWELCKPDCPHRLAA